MKVLLAQMQRLRARGHVLGAATRSHSARSAVPPWGAAYVGVDVDVVARPHQQVIGLSVIISLGRSLIAPC
jgi:hypothetical protein